MLDGKIHLHSFRAGTILTHQGEQVKLKREGGRQGGKEGRERWEGWEGEGRDGREGGKRDEKLLDGKIHLYSFRAGTILTHQGEQVKLMRERAGGREGREGGGQNSTFSEHGCVAYQIKGNHRCSNMLANILPTFCPQTPNHLTLGVESKGQNSTFSEHGHVAYQIKGMEPRAPYKHIFSPYTHMQPIGWIKR